MTTLFLDTFTSSNAAWSKRGTFTDSYSGGGATFSGVDAGEGMWMTLASLGLSTGDYTVEVALTKSNTAGQMVGPILADDTGAGFCLSHYHSPAGLLVLSCSGWTYSSSFATAVSESSTPSARYRVRRSGTTYYCSRSLDGGTTWSTEYAHTFSGTVTRIGFGCTFGSLTSGTTLSSATYFAVTDVPTTTHVLAGSVAATSGAAGALLVNPSLGGVVAASSAVSGGMVVPLALAGTVAATSGVSGALSPDLPVTTQRTYGWSWRIDATADVDAPADPTTLVPRPIVAVSAPFPTLVDGRPV